FLARHDLVWNRLPTGWGESAFIGNGRLGATIDVQGGALGWTINRTDFVHDQSRFPIGRVVLKTTGTVQGGDARLTLWDAEASGTVTTDRGAVRWRSFTAAAPSVIVIVLEGGGGAGHLDRDWWPGRKPSHRKTCIRRRPSRARRRVSRACRRSSMAGRTPSRSGGPARGCSTSPSVAGTRSATLSPRLARRRTRRPGWESRD